MIQERRQTDKTLRAVTLGQLPPWIAILYTLYQLSQKLDQIIAIMQAHKSP